MPRSFLYYFVSAFALGIAVATFQALSFYTICWVLLLGGAFLLVAWREGGEAKPPLLLFSISLLLFGLGLLRFDWASDDFAKTDLSDSVGTEVTLEGYVFREPDKRVKVTYIHVQVGENDRVLVSLDRQSRIKYGDVVSLQGKLAIPENFTTDLGREFNYLGYLQVQGIKYQINFAEVTVLKTGEGNWLLTKLYDFKDSFIQNLEVNIAEPEVGLGKGLLLGIKKALPADLEKAFRETGIIHIVVLSGYNIMLVVLFINFILGYFFKPRIKVVVALLAIVSFAFMVGLSATVLRASVMAGIMLLALLGGRKYLALRGVFVEGFLMLWFNPLLLVFGVGFQLSFLATLGLILLSPRLQSRLTFIPERLNLRGLFCATLATTIFVTPLLLFAIGELSLVSLIVNLLVLPMVPIAMLLVASVGFLGYLSSSLALLFSFPAYFSLLYINKIALWFSNLPLASVTIPSFSFWYVPFMYLLVVLLFFWLKPKEEVEETVELSTIFR